MAADMARQVKVYFGLKSITVPYSNWNELKIRVKWDSHNYYFWLCFLFLSGKSKIKYLIK
ncbi:hypothetical protein PDY_27680 [Photobacterium damselae subsp. damselae]|nr:hypothetical protein PDY_27680 [Photobacterium damselae subsp. damselae]